MRELRDFAARLIEAQGGLVEEDAAHLHALLPEPLTDALKIPEESTLSTDPQAGMIPISYGSLALEKMLTLVTGAIPYAHGRLTDVHIPSRSAVTRAAGAFSLRNGLFEIEGLVQTKAWRLVLYSALTLSGDEKKQALLSSALSVKTLAPVRGFDSFSFAKIEPPGRASKHGPLPADLQPLLQAALDEAWRGAERDIAAFQARMTRRLEQDQARIHEYFEGLNRELAIRHRRRRFEEADLRSRLQAFERDRAAKLDALTARYTLNAEIRPISVALIQAPIFSLTLQLRRRKAKAQLKLEYDCFTQSLIPTRCVGCGGETLKPVACDDALHLICERCAPESRGRPRCVACG